jgi:hypothetical protein
MSENSRQEWLESAWQNFEQALEKGNIAFAKAVIADTQEEGFFDAARSMNARLRILTIKNNGTLIFLKKKKAEYEEKGYIPTLDLLIEELETVEADE